MGRPFYFSTMRLKQLTKTLEKWAPLSLQADYDNCGLAVGNPEMALTGAVVAIDVTEAVIDQAIESGANLVLTHHPIVFKPLRNLSGSDLVQRCLRQAIKHDIALYSLHTNLDSIPGGVSHEMATRMQVADLQILQKRSGELYQLAVMVPHDSTSKVMEALFAAGAGRMGHYQDCAFVTDGEGRFMPTQGAMPYAGDVGKPHVGKEQKVEVLVSAGDRSRVMAAMKEAHPFETISHQWLALDQPHPEVGYGVVGTLVEPMSPEAFIDHVKQCFGLKVIRHSAFVTDQIHTVAMCGGSGADLLPLAIQKKADVFITADVSYHRFFEPDGDICMMDIGHWESEQFTKDLIMRKVQAEFPNFAVLQSDQPTNPVLIS